jgi:hypothetical protein
MWSRIGFSGLEGRKSVAHAPRVAPLFVVNALCGRVAQIDLKAVDRARSRGLLARVQVQIKIVLVVERGLEARGYVLHFCIRRLGESRDYRRPRRYLVLRFGITHTYSGGREVIPLLSKEGSRAAAGWSVQSREASL